VAQQEATVKASPSEPVVRPETKEPRVAERPEPISTVTQDIQAPKAEMPEPIAPSEPETGQFTLDQVQQVWDRVLVAVRQRNPATEGALRTDCRPVEVTSNQIVVAFPFPFLREKLADPQRKVEIQDALSQVLGSNCYVKLVLATEHMPRQEPSSQPAPSSPEQDPAAPVMDAKDLDQITRWAKEHGGEAKIIEET
jgi:hypothetical protein